MSSNNTSTAEQAASIEEITYASTKLAEMAEQLKESLTKFQISLHRG